MENKKKVYSSTKEYIKKYNKKNINIQIDRDLVNRIRVLIKEQKISLKEYIESVLKDKL